MAIVTIHQAKTNLSRIIEEVLAGREVVIARGKKPLVKIVPLPEARKQRRLDGSAGSVKIAPDFDEPLEDFAEYSR